MKALAWLIGLSLVSCGCRPREQPSAPAPVDSSSTDAAPAAFGLLYAQRAAEIHFQSPSGPVIGRVHPGARVEVAPTDAGHVRIVLPAVFTWDKRNEQLVALVDNDVFSPTPRPLAAVTFPAAISGYLMAKLVEAFGWETGSTLMMTALLIVPIFVSLLIDTRLITGRGRRVSEGSRLLT